MPSVSTMERTIIVMSDTSQLIHLPKSVAFPDSVKQLNIIPLGRARLLVPEGEDWDSWFNRDGVTDDFMVERNQPGDQDRVRSADI